VARPRRSNIFITPLRLPLKRLKVALRGDVVLSPTWRAVSLYTFGWSGIRVESQLVSALSEPTFAWEPLTPRGVAAFARASFGRLFLVQTIVAVGAVLAVLFFLEQGVFPTVSAAIEALPDQGKIEHGRLQWTGESPVLLAEGNILAFVVDTDHGGEVRSPADFQFEFGTNSVFILSLFGPAEVAYPPDYAPNTHLPANKTDLRPLWDAWRPDVLALVAAGMFAGLLVTWFVLATLYCVPVWLIGYFSQRELGLRAAWRLAGAALMPGAVLFSLTLVAYELGVCDLVQFLFIFGLHLVVGWIYLFVAPLFLNRAGAKPPKNPFQKAGGE